MTSFATAIGSDKTNGFGAGTSSRRLLAAMLLLLWILPLQACRPDRSRSSPRRSGTQMREMALPEVRLRRGSTGARHTNPRGNLKAGSR
jgi:hypothetical protein